MRTINRKGALAGVLGGVSMCALAMSATAQSKSGINPAMEQVGDPLHPPLQLVRTPPSPITGSGGIAGLAPVVHNNGPVETTTCNGTVMCAGTLSTLQNVAPVVLNVFGFTSLGPTFKIADDLVLTSTTDLQQIEFYSYNTNATTPTITGASVTLLADAAGPGAPVPGCGPTTSLFSPIALSGIFRIVQGAGGTCNRNLQRIIVDVSSWPDLAPGTYWVSMEVSGAPSAFMPPVSICGSCGKVGANGRQWTGATWVAVTDGTGGVCVPAVPQDFPFIAYGDTVGGPTCDGDADGDGDTDVDDLIAVILDWGCVGAPGVCDGDVNNSGATDVDDLIAVILDWGCT
jgi:hypothetical protein